MALGSRLECDTFGSVEIRQLLDILFGEYGLIFTPVFGSEFDESGHVVL